MLGIEFGEKLLYKVKKDAKMPKAREIWEYGIFVGVKRRSGEVWLAADRNFQREVIEKNIRWR